jgi:hypothetical protein
MRRVYAEKSRNLLARYYNVFGPTLLRALGEVEEKLEIDRQIARMSRRKRVPSKLLSLFVHLTLYAHL